MDKFGPEILVIQFGFLVIVSTIFLWLWFSNRRKYHNLKHAIPANIVKSYLDSIIQNSTSLKSQLFRGGGLDVGGVPSVIPLQQLMGGDGLAMSGAPSTALLEELNQKKAHIAVLESQLASLREIESKLDVSQGNLGTAQAKIKELEALLAQNRTSGGGDAALKAEIGMVTKERDDLRDRLREFEVIADDLANLKRLQQENEQLKRSLAAQGHKLPEPEVKEKEEVSNSILNQAEVSDLFEDLGQSEPASTDNAVLEEFLSADSEESTEEAQADESKSKSEKTPEDLLSEFEKMLG
jgi:hypothetical protein